MSDRVLTLQELDRLLADESPQMYSAERGLEAEAVRHGGCCARQRFQPHYV